jgi:hypothetical protein
MRGFVYCLIDMAKELETKPKTTHDTSDENEQEELEKYCQEIYAKEAKEMEERLGISRKRKNIDEGDERKNKADLVLFFSFCSPLNRSISTFTYRTCKQHGRDFLLSPSKARNYTMQWTSMWRHTSASRMIVMGLHAPRDHIQSIAGTSSTTEKTKHSFALRQEIWVSTTRRTR